METNTWDALEHLVATRNGLELSALLQDLIAHSEIEDIDKNEILRQVIGQNNFELLDAIAPLYDLSVDSYIYFQTALFERLDNIVPILAPPPTDWKNVILELLLDQEQAFVCLDRWSNWAQNDSLDLHILQAMESNFYTGISDGLNFKQNLIDRMKNRATHATLTQAVETFGSSKVTKKM